MKFVEFDIDTDTHRILLGFLYQRFLDFFNMVGPVDREDHARLWVQHLVNKEKFLSCYVTLSFKEGNKYGPVVSHAVVSIQDTKLGPVGFLEQVHADKADTQFARKVIEAAKDYAKQFGCVRLMASQSRDRSRALIKNYGFKHDQTIVYIPLESLESLERKVSGTT